MDKLDAEINRKIGIDESKNLLMKKKSTDSADSVTRLDDDDEDEFQIEFSKNDSHV